MKKFCLCCFLLECDIVVWFEENHGPLNHHHAIPQNFSRFFDDHDQGLNYTGSHTQAVDSKDKQKNHNIYFWHAFIICVGRAQHTFHLSHHLSLCHFLTVTNILINSPPFVAYNFLGDLPICLPPLFVHNSKYTCNWLRLIKWENIIWVLCNSITKHANLMHSTNKHE